MKSKNPAACLQSLIAQSEDIFQLGRDWELVVVNDHSTDRTAEIARSFPGVTLSKPPVSKKGWTGKNSAIWTAARKARGRWLLFTDADTIHEPGDIHRAMHKATRTQSRGAELFATPACHRFGAAHAECRSSSLNLPLAYPPAKVSGSPNQRIAAANGQFLFGRAGSLPPPL